MAIQLRVLHVDDDQLFLATAKEVLQDTAKDIAVDTASSVDEAISKVMAEEYDAVISDYDMPIKNGLDLLRQLRERNISTPFILFTGKGREDVAIEALNLGVDHYLNKQGTPETVYRELATSIHRLNEKTKATKFLREHKGIPIESMPGAVAVIDFNGNVVDGNSNLEKISGYKKEELIGKSVFTLDFTSQESFAAIAERFSDVFTGNMPAEPVEYSFNRKDGSNVCVEFSAFPIKRDTEPAILCVINDVTERKNVEDILKKTLQRLHVAQEAAKSGIWEWNLETGENVWSDETWQLYGLTADGAEASYERWLETIHPEDRERAAKAVSEAAKKRTELYVEYRLSDAHGKGRWLMSRGQPQQNAIGIVDRYLGVIIDITERKKAEEDLRRSHEKMEIVNHKLQVVGSLTRHDISNKLMGAKANMYLLRKKLKDSPELLQYVDSVDEAFNQSGKILEFSGMYEKIGAETPVLTQVSEQFNLAAKLIPHSGVEITNDAGDLTVMADSMLQQLFYNLIDNSLKHGKTANKIRLSFQQDTNQIRLVYEDNGVGVAEENKVKIFSNGFTTGGSGLGLKLVKRMINVYGWTISEEGEQGKGAKFVITIPCAQSAISVH